MRGWRFLVVLGVAVPLIAADTKVDLSKEQVGKPPTVLEPMVGTWVVAQDGTDKVIMVDGRPWVGSKDNPTKLLIESARKLYGTSNEELMDNAKQFAYYPVAVLRGHAGDPVLRVGLQVGVPGDVAVVASHQLLPRIGAFWQRIQ